MSPTPDKDAELVRRMRAGDEPAFLALYREHRAAVYRFALLMSGSAALAEEASQEVFLSFIRRSAGYEPTSGSLRSYLVGNARHQVLRLLKRENSFVPFEEEQEDSSISLEFIVREDPLTDCTRKELVRLVRQAVLALPVRYREVVVLCDFHEMRYAEAAQLLQCPVGTVNSRLHRAHELLMKKLRASTKLQTNAADEEWLTRLRCFA